MQKKTVAVVEIVEVVSIVAALTVAAATGVVVVDHAERRVRAGVVLGSEGERRRLMEVNTREQAEHLG